NDRDLIFKSHRAGMMFSSGARLKSKCEDAEEGDLNRERLLNVSSQMIAQLFETPNAAKNFRGLQFLREDFGLLPRGGKLALLHARVGPQHIRPPEEDRLEQPRTLAHVLAFRERFEIIFALVQPRAVCRLPVAGFFSLQGSRVLRLNGLTNLPEQTMKAARQSIGRLHAFRRGPDRGRK